MFRCRYIDNDVSGISVAEAGTLLAVEGAAGAVVGFVLDSEPLADVVVYVTVNDTVNCAVVSGHRLTFGTATWATEQFLEVEALEDDRIDDSVVCAVFVDILAQDDPMCVSFPSTFVLEHLSAPLSLAGVVHQLVTGSH